MTRQWRRVWMFGLMMVLPFLGSMMEGAETTSEFHYDFKFNGGISSQYTFQLPNTYQFTPEGQSDNFSGKSINIGSPLARPYKIRGHYRIELSNQSLWNERKDAPYFRIAGIVSPVYKFWPGGNPFRLFSAEGDFEIPKGETAIITYSTGHYLSRFLGLFWTTNQWGITGHCIIDLYLDSEKPDPPKNVKLNDASMTKNITGGTATLSWETPNDNPVTPKGNYEASGIKGYKIFDGETDITPGGGFVTGLSQTLTLAGEREHAIKIRAYDHEENASDPVIVCAWVDQTPPTGNFCIRSKNGFTNKSNVTLSVTNLIDGSIGSKGTIGSYGAGAEGSGLSQVGFSNDNVNYTWFDCNQSNLTKSWLLSAGDGPKTVYMKLKDRAGNITNNENAVPATVILDTTPPNGGFTINNGATIASSQQVVLTLGAEDNLSGMAGMMFSNDGVNFSITEAYAVFKPWILSPQGGNSKSVFVKFTDNAGNTSTAIMEVIDYNSTPVYPDPTPEITLLADETWTEDRTVNGRIIIPVGVTLIIGPRVTVTIDGPTGSDPYQNGFIIQGTLIVKTGVTFTAQTPKPGWMGIVVSGAATITGATISQAQQGITSLIGATVTVSGSAFSQNFAGIHVYESHLAVTNCVFQENTYGIKEDVLGETQRPAVNGCTFSANWAAYSDDQYTQITMEQLNAIPGNGGNH